MFAMNAVTVYVNAAKLVLQITESNLGCAQDLSRILPHLRQLLSCAVCCRLANDPYVPRHGRCAHNVCRLCVRGNKKLQPLCNYCKDNCDFKSYNESKQMRCLLLCYKSLCDHLKSSSIFGQLMGRKLHPCNTLSPSVILMPQTLQDLVVEGTNYDDILSNFSNEQPKPNIVVTKMAPLPALVSPLSTTAATPLPPHNTNTTLNQSAPIASTPPSSTTCIAETVPAIKVKLEKLSPTSCTAQQQASNIVNAPPLHALTAAPQPALVQLNQLKGSTNITYIAPNARGIVVPIVSSSGTTTAPLTIASARLQSLNRQLAQARVISSVSTVNANAMDIKPNLSTFKVSLAAACPNAKTPIAISNNHNTNPIGTTNNVCSMSSVSVRNPPPIKTVSNGSAMYSVLYTGIGNKITIKRKTDGDEDAHQKKRIGTPTPTPTTMATGTGTISTMHRTLGKNILNKRRGCRCGNATPTPGKLTCCGQRCPCYVDSKSCIGCKCRGCRNPHRPGGGKVRPIIPELACYEIQMADEHSNPIGPHDMPLTSAVGTTACSRSMNLPPGLNFTNAGSITTTVTTLPSLSTNRTTCTPNLLSYCEKSISTAPPPLAPTTTPATYSHATHNTNCTGQSSTTANIYSQLEHLPRESVLVQNAQGKYQVVNLFTSSNSQTIGHPVPSLQRIHSLPKMSATAAVSNSYIVSSNNTTTTNSTLPQIIIQPQHVQGKQQHLLVTPSQRSIAKHTGSSVTTVASNTLQLPLQLKQQLKQNVITVHTINPTTKSLPTTTSILSTPSPANTTASALTLTPLIVSSLGDSSNMRPLMTAANIYSNPTTNMLNLTAATINRNNATSTMHNTVTRTVRTKGIVDIFDTGKHN